MYKSLVATVHSIFTLREVIQRLHYFYYIGFTKCYNFHPIGNFKSGDTYFINVICIIVAINEICCQSNTLWINYHHDAL